jgi:hypothetical protein
VTRLARLRRRARRRTSCLALVAALSLASLASAEEADSSGGVDPGENGEVVAEDPDAPGSSPSRARRSTGDDAAMLAPIGLSDARSLGKGEFALSYRYSLIHGDDIRDGTSRESTDETLRQFDETPRERDLHVHLFGLSYAPHRRVTLSARLPFIHQETKVTAGAPRRNFETDSSGIGDLELRALVPFMRKRNESLQVELGISVPTGRTGARDKGADGSKERLPFPQQLGSGTVDLLTGMVYRGRRNTLSWGVAARAKFRLYENSKDYRMGHQFMMSSWLAQSWTDWMSTSLRFSWQRRDNVHPKDRNLVNPERDPKRQAGDTLDIGPGVNFAVPFLGDPRFGVEMTWPFYQNLTGPQVERDWHLTTGLEWAF